ncbi:hypothetical protein NJB1907f44_20440 [Mycobacterium marinum]|uniref:Uncharacterized protein n=1 Tax=Mycobacterium shottsii TaxID=133549 RepID=A0A7I7LJ17_9MYCO|nr:hypothetical protein MSHO_51530 [Mycobacterium shottsii]GJO02757.1 hypothetical protein NJB1907E90_08320 [Mycobacterium marinum]GJO10197.1 hypothetical protein NJB1808e29_45230 [Mycobacterium marinum]GJO13676.1 hypothetical protein NJB1907f34b_49480 [Mycobacterium marinum]GJO46828.1 hypothetical protein NJB1907E19_41830 [Mycobacterium marinum]
MQSQRQLHDPKIRSQVSPGGGDPVHQKLSDLLGQITQLRLRQVLQISGTTDLFQHPASVRSACASEPSLTSAAHHLDGLIASETGEPGSLVGV